MSTSTRPIFRVLMLVLGEGKRSRPPLRSLLTTRALRERRRQRFDLLVHFIW